MHRLVTGRPPTSAELTALIERLATENNGWGVQELCRTLHNQRIQGELTGLGYKIAPSTVWRILDNAGIDPAPTRLGQTWRAFLAGQATTILAADFIHVGTVLLRRLSATSTAGNQPGASAGHHRRRLPAEMPLNGTN